MSYDLEDMVVDRIIERLGEGDRMRDISQDIGIIRPLLYVVLHDVGDEKQEALREANQSRQEYYQQEAAYHRERARHSAWMAERDPVWLDD